MDALRKYRSPVLGIRMTNKQSFQKSQRNTIVSIIAAQEFTVVRSAVLLGLVVLCCKDNWMRNGKSIRGRARFDRLVAKGS